MKEMRLKGNTAKCSPAVNLTQKEIFQLPFHPSKYPVHITELKKKKNLESPKNAIVYWENTWLVRVSKLLFSQHLYYHEQLA